MKSVSIIIPSYNHADFIKKTIESCINQSYKGFIEIIVVDDCSTDRTSVVLDFYRDYKTQARAVYIHEKKENKGINDSISFALAMCSGDYVQIIGSDDVLLLNKIEINIEFLEYGDYDCIYSGAYILGDEVNSQSVNYNKFLHFYNNGNAFDFVCVQDTSSPLLQSALFLKSVLLDSFHIRDNYKSDDWALMIYVFSRYKVGFMNIPLIKYRQHKDNTFKKYLKTFPMRVDVISNLVPYSFQCNAYSNIFLSQGLYYSKDDKFNIANKFYMGSFCFNPSFKVVFHIVKNALNYIVFLMRGVFK